MFRLKKGIHTETSDEDLWRETLKGQKVAFELLYARYFNKLVWYANSFVQDPFEAQDIVQEVFITLIESPEKYDPERTFSTWIYTVTANKSKNRIRSTKIKTEWHKTLQTIQGDALSKLHHHVDMKTLNQQLNQIFNSLNDKEQQVFTLRFEQQKTIKEIAIEMSIPEGSVKSCLFYMLKKYSSLLKHFNYES